MEILSQNKETMAYRKASRRVKELKEFYGNLTSYCLVIPFLAVLNFMTSPGYLWFLWPMLGWGIGIGFHALNVFGLGKSWEEKKIRELMDQENRKTKTL
ncbi:2TM domain-containing protein [Chryseobacterium sp. JK1]|uniref:2TM domain-containing protein n=1 Tax=Chryseobacterium sp. JK1 TaxID=874294 RepID=UPI003D693E2A